MVLRARGGAGLDQMQVDRFEQGWMALAHRHENVGGEPPVPGARLDEIEGAMTRAGEERGHLGDLQFEQLAEQRTDVDAGEKIARAARTLAGAGVVAELGVVQRQLHERGHRYRAAFTNAR